MEAAETLIKVQSTVKKARQPLPHKPEKQIWFSFQIGGKKIERGPPHWTEILFIIVIIGSCAMLGVVGDPNMAQNLDTISKIGGWTATGVCLITMWFNYGLYDRKRNAESAAYLEGYVKDLEAHNRHLREGVESQEEQIKIEQMRQEQAKESLKQLKSVVDSLGDTKQALQMVNQGMDNFLKENTKSLVKMEKETRDFQVGMIDRGIDRLTNLLIYSFHGLDKDGSQCLEGEEMCGFLDKLSKYKLVSSKQEFFDSFPIGLDVNCGDAGDDLVARIMNRSPVAKGWSDDKKAAVRKELCTINTDDPEALDALVEKVHKRKFLDLIVKHKLANSVEAYFDTLHAVDTWVIDQGMGIITDQLKARGKTALENFDRLMLEVFDKEAELKKQNPSPSTRIELGQDVIDAAKRGNVQKIVARK
jgi:hypothetical protein